MRKPSKLSCSDEDFFKVFNKIHNSHLIESNVGTVKINTKKSKD